MTARDGDGRLSPAEVDQLREAVAAWRASRGDPAAKAAVQDLVVALTDRGVRRQEIAAAAGVPVGTVGGWKSGRPKPTDPAPVRRDPSGREIGRLRRLLNRVPYTGRHYRWTTSPEGQKFVAAAKALVRAGVPARRLAVRLAEGAPVQADAITQQLRMAPPRLGSGIRRGGRPRLTPDVARAPRHTRPVTPDEWAHLLGLQAAIELRSAYSAYTTEERQAAAAPLIARDIEILRLWKDRVADAHIADLLGLTDDAISRARRHARAITNDPDRYRRVAPPPPKPKRPHLSDAERELLRAAYERVRADARGYAHSPHLPQLIWLLRGHRERVIPAAELAGALGISRYQYYGLLKAAKQQELATNGAADRSRGDSAVGGSTESSAV